MLERGKYQPRVDMRQEALEELAISIRNQGVIQPIVVRPLPAATRPGEPQRYEIIAGERRWRAAQIAGLATIPAVIRRVPGRRGDRDGADREHPAREPESARRGARARATDRRVRRHAPAGRRCGRPIARRRVSNLLRLLELAPEVAELVEKRQLEMGHARALLPLTNRRQQAEVGALVARNGLSVRETEALVRKMLAPPAGGGDAAAPEKIDPNIARLQTDLSERLGAKVLIQQGSGGKGKLVVSYNSLDELDGILAHIHNSINTCLGSLDEAVTGPYTARAFRPRGNFTSDPVARSGYPENRCADPALAGRGDGRDRCHLLRSDGARAQGFRPWRVVASDCWPMSS